MATIIYNVIQLLLVVVKKMSKWYYDAISLPKEERQRLRSKTFQGIADAMADQWG